MNFYDFTKDQGSLISGLLTLAAGLLAYLAGMLQAKEARRQGDIAVRMESRRRASEGIQAAKALSGLIGQILSDIDKIVMDFSKPGSEQIFAYNPLKTRLRVPDWRVAMPFLGQFDSETISYYFSVINEVETLQGPRENAYASSLKTELENFRLRVEHLLTLFDLLSRRCSESLKITEVLLYQ